MSLTYIDAKQDRQEAVLTSGQPGKIVAWDLSQGPVLTTRGSFVAAFGRDLNINGVAGCRRILFGGDGLFMTRLTGPVRVLLQTLKRLSTAPKKGGGG